MKRKAEELAQVDTPSEAEMLNAIEVLVRRLLAGTAVQTVSAEPDAWLSPAAAAKHAGVSADTLRQWISSGQLFAGRVNRVIRIRRSDVDGLLSRRSAIDLREASSNQERSSQGASPSVQAILTSIRRERRS